MKSGLASGVGWLWRSTAEAFRDSRRRHALQQEFQNLGDIEGNRILQDCGMSRSEFAASVQNALPLVDLLSPAMLAIGLDPVELRKRRPDWSRDLGHACMSCQYRRRCRNDVTAQRFAARYRQYCLNSDSLDEMANARKLP